MARTRGTPSKPSSPSDNSGNDAVEKRRNTRRSVRRSRGSGLSLALLARLSFHLAAVSALTYPFVWIVKHPNKMNAAYGWHFQYLTILTLTLAYATFVLAVVLDILPTNPKTSLGKAVVFAVRATKRIFLIISAPAECLVSLIYWPLHFIDPTLLAPPELVAAFPLTADLSMHALPTILLLVEVFAFSGAFDASAATGASIYLGYGTGYYAWMTHCAGKNGWYPYPMLDAMTEPQRAAVVYGAVALAFGAFLALKATHAKVHGISAKATVAAKHGKKLTAK